MTRSAQKLLVKQKTEDLELKNPQVSIEQSVQFMQKLTVVAVSSIAFLRDIFPSSAFSEKKLEGLPVRILRGDENIPGTETLTNWLKKAFEAVKQHFLKKMILVIQRQGSESTLEVYTFTFSYDQESISYKLQNESEGHEILIEKENSQEVPKDIKKAVQQMLRSVLTYTTTLQPLPNDCELSMKLELTDEVPEDYSLPDCFQPISSLGLEFPQDITTLKLGKVQTKFTSLALSTKTVLCQIEGEVDNPDDDDDIILSSQDQQSLPPTVKLDSEETTHLSEVLSSKLSLMENKVSCICECTDKCMDDLKCASCFAFQHRACYKVLQHQQVENHICVECHEPNNANKTCTNSELVKDKKRKENALYRRALVLCLSSIRVSANFFVTQLSVSQRFAKQILNRLDKDGWVRPAYGKGNLRIVKTDHLKENVLNLFLSSSENDYAMETDENNLNLSNLNESKTNSSEETKITVIDSAGAKVNKRKLNYVPEMDDNAATASRNPKRLKYCKSRFPEKI